MDRRPLTKMTKTMAFQLLSSILFAQTFANRVHVSLDFPERLRLLIAVDAPLGLLSTTHDSCLSRMETLSEHWLVESWKILSAEKFFFFSKMFLQPISWQTRKANEESVRGRSANISLSDFMWNAWISSGVGVRSLAELMRMVEQCTSMEQVHRTKDVTNQLMFCPSRKNLRVILLDVKKCISGNDLWQSLRSMNRKFLKNRSRVPNEGGIFWWRHGSFIGPYYFLLKILPPPSPGKLWSLLSVGIDNLRTSQKKARQMPNHAKSFQCHETNSSKISPLPTSKH